MMPHACHVHTATGAVTLESRGEVRLKSMPQLVVGDLRGMPLVPPQAFVGVDESSKGYALFEQVAARGDAVGIIVSAVMAEWLLKHDPRPYHLYAPATGPAHAVRDDKGQIKGCRALEVYR